MINTPTRLPSGALTDKIGNIIDNTGKQETDILLNSDITNSEILDIMITEIGKKILASDRIKDNLTGISQNGLDTKIPNIGNYDLGSTIRDEYKKILNHYKKFKKGKKDAFKIFRKTLDDISDKDIFQEKFKTYSEEIEDIADQMDKKKFIIRVKPLVELLTITRIISWEEIANIRYENSKEGKQFLKEGSPRNFEINKRDYNYDDNIFVPKNTIELHIGYISSEKNNNITKIFLEGFGLVRNYLLQHPECPGVMMSSRLIYSIVKEKPNIAKRIGLTEKNTSIDEKGKIAVTFIERDIFLRNQK